MSQSLSLPYNCVLTRENSNCSQCSMVPLPPEHSSITRTVAQIKVIYRQWELKLFKMAGAISLVCVGSKERVPLQIKSSCRCESTAARWSYVANDSDSQGIRAEKLGHCAPLMVRPSPVKEFSVKLWSINIEEWACSSPAIEPLNFFLYNCLQLCIWNSTESPVIAIKRHF